YKGEPGMRRCLVMALIFYLPVALRGVVRRYFVTGLLILVPLSITLWMLVIIVGTLDQSLLLLPDAWQPRVLVGMDVPGVGTILTLLIIFVTGAVAHNYFGRKLVNIWESLLTRI